MGDDLLSQLTNAKSDEEREEIVLRFSLKALSDPLQKVVFAAAIPHWFDGPFLAAILPVEETQAEEWLQQLKSLSFVESYPDRGWAIHERTRRRLLAILWRDDQSQFREYSARAAEYCFPKSSGADHWVMEGIYLELVGNPDHGAELLCNTGWEWQNSPNYWYEKVEMLARMAKEHMEAGRLSNLCHCWTLFWLAHIARIYNRNAEAISLLRSIDLESITEDPYFTGSFLLEMGEVHRMLSELPQARICFEKSLSLNQGINNRLGEANCIRELGDVYQELSELHQAQARYEEALSIYQAIGNRLGEANCIKRLGDVHQALSELPRARARYEEALPIYRANGDRLGEANCISRLGDIHQSLSELPEARACYEEVLPIYQAIGNRLGEANCISRLGKVMAEEGRSEEAERALRRSLAIFEELGLPSQQSFIFNRLASLNERQGDLEQALDLLTQAINQFPGHPINWRNRASILLQLRRLDEALEDLRQAAALQPGHPYLSLRYGDLALLENRLEEAATFFNQILEQRPRLNYAHFGLGRLALLKHNRQAALAEYQKGLDVSDSPDDLRDEIAELSRWTQEHSELQKEIEEILQMLRDFHHQPG